MKDRLTKEEMKKNMHKGVKELQRNWDIAEKHACESPKEKCGDELDTPCSNI